MIQVGITEYIDASLNTTWSRWAFDKRNPIILITKNIKKLLEMYPGIETRQNILIHSTITGYGSSFLEPNVPDPKELLKFLSTRNIDRIILRIDPIVPIEEFIDQSLLVYKKGIEMGFKRIRISVLDLYPHVLNRLNVLPNFQYQLKQIYNWDMSHSIDGIHKEYMNHAPLGIRQKIFDLFKNTEICGEPSVKCQGCISKKDLEAFGIKPDMRYPKNEQREFCPCLGIKKNFGALKEDCEHGCLYCYKYN